MKLIIDGYEVEIKARKIYREKANKNDTMAILNTLSLLASEAAEYYENRSQNALGDWAREVGSEIYNKLKEEGLYKGI